jgi:hypothetical protein
MFNNQINPTIPQILHSKGDQNIHGQMALGKTLQWQQLLFAIIQRQNKIE